MQIVGAVGYEAQGESPSIQSTKEQFSALLKAFRANEKNNHVQGIYDELIGISFGPKNPYIFLKCFNDNPPRRRIDSHNGWAKKYDKSLIEGIVEYLGILLLIFGFRDN